MLWDGIKITTANEFTKFSDMKKRFYAGDGIFPLIFVISFFVLGSAPSAKTVAANSMVGMQEDSIQSHEFTPAFELKIGGEGFYSIEPATGNGFGGIAAIMVDMDASIHEHLDFFAAFHFDSALWDDFLNKPRLQREGLPPEHRIDLTVEEFFLSWIPMGEILEIMAGRRFSGFSYANRLHLADFQFNMKPRIFTTYWGDNHGLALDGISLRVTLPNDGFSTSFMVEAAKSAYGGDQTVMTSVLDAGFSAGNLDIGLRGFGYFDHQTFCHPLLNYCNEDISSQLTLDEGFALNAFGGGTNLLWKTGGRKSVFFQAEWIGRRIMSNFLYGGYAFAKLVHSEKVSSSFMVQQLEMPDFLGEEPNGRIERSYNPGISYFPMEKHRFRLEYHYSDNSIYYRNMLLFKYTFFLDF